MKPKQLLLLILLSAIWGGSFIFMRVLAPVFGPAGTATLRLLIAAIFLLAYYQWTRYKIQWQRDWKLLLLLGIINSAVPFICYSYAAMHIPASLSVIINTMSPMFGAAFAALILKDRLSMDKIIGLVLGTTGVAVITGSKALTPSVEAYLSVGACLLATFCYGLAGALTKKYASGIEAKALAGGSQLFAGLALLPFLLTTGTLQPVTINIAVLMILFAILSSAIAYLIYYYLLKEIGPVKAMTSTFLMPAFGIFWSWLLLGEKLHGSMLIGAMIIMSGTYLVIWPRRKKIKGEDHAY